VHAAAERHTMMTWGMTKPMMDAALWLERGEGVYMIDADGKRYMDMNSGAMCLHLGHTPPPEVLDAVREQLDTLAYCYPGVSVTPVRARLSALLADILPGDIDAFLFPSTGAEANEAAVRIARLYTGRHKVLTRYRSYHGATATTLAMTGDLRRWPAEHGAHGHVHFMDPWPYSFRWGESADEVAHNNLAYVRELLDAEGPHTVAAIVVEPVTGTNGLIRPPPGYLRGLRELCDEHGIMLICDEVMNGFGRTGRWFGFEHSDGVIPDIVTGAKGINGAFLPLGMVGLRAPIAEHFRTHAIGVGSTYNSHPVVLASAYGALRHMLKNDVVGHAQRMESVMVDGFNTLLERHASVKQARVIGMFGGFDVQKNRRGDFVAKVHEPLPPALVALKNELVKNGLFTMMRGHQVFVLPPLVSTEAEIRHAFDIFDRSLHVCDDMLED